MIQLSARTVIAAPCEEVWDFFADLDERYVDWHPDHRTWRTLSGPPVTQGAIVFIDEWIGRLHLTGRARLSEVQRGRFLRWDMLFPYSLAGVGGWFALEPAGDRCILVAEVHIGLTVPFLGPLLDHVIAVVVPLADLRCHMVEEGRNLARLSRDWAALKRREPA